MNQAFVTRLGTGVIIKQLYKTGKVPDLPHIMLLTNSSIQALTFILPNFFLYSHQNATEVTQNLGDFQIQT